MGIGPGAGTGTGAGIGARAGSGGRMWRARCVVDGEWGRGRSRRSKV